MSDKEKDIDKDIQKSNKFVKSFTNKRFTSGAYSTVISIIVVALVVVLNLAFNNLDLSYDLTSNSRYSLSEDSKKVLKEVDVPITIYYLVTENGAEEKIKKSVYSYKDVVSKVKVEEKDPVLYPAFGREFGIEDELANNDVIVVNEETKTAKYISNGSMLFSAVSSDNTLNGETLDVEGKITSAIQYVIDGTVTKLYYLEGHEETLPGDDYLEALDKLNVEMQKLNLMTKGEVPEDCHILYIGGPIKDLKDDETELILDYLKNGGHAIIITRNTFAADSGEKLDNFNKILDYYGVKVENGFIYEGAGHYYQAQTYVIPEVNTDTDITSNISSQLIIPAAEALVMPEDKEVRTTLKRTAILTTSDKSFIRTDLSDDSSDMNDSDIKGPAIIGLYMEDAADNGETGKVVLYSSTYFTRDNENGVVYNWTNENVKLITNAVSAMLDSDVEAVSIPVKSLEDVVVNISNANQILLAIVIIMLIPGTLLIMGFVIWMFRRKK